MFIPRNDTLSVHIADTPEEAEALAARYHPLIRQFHFFADIYPDEQLVLLEAPEKEMLEKMTATLNYLLEHPED